MRNFSVLVSVLLLSATASAAESVRKCWHTGITARCGDAMSLVRCEGYDKAYHLANDQEISKLSLGLYIGPPRIDREFVDGYASIQTPKADFRAYDLVLAWHGEDILNGRLQDPSTLEEQSYQRAVADILEALKTVNPSISANPEVDSLAIGAFEIPSNAPLYTSCYKSKGVAPFKTASEKPAWKVRQEQLRAANKARDEADKKRMEERFKINIRDNETAGDTGLLALEFMLDTKGKISRQCHLTTVGNGTTALLITSSNSTIFIYRDYIDVFLRELGLTPEDCKTPSPFTLENGKRL